MGFERDPAYQDVETLPFTSKRTIAAARGICYGDAKAGDPGSVWTEIEPGATDSSATGNCFESFTLRNVGSTNALNWAFTQTDAQFSSPQSQTLDCGEAVSMEGSEFAKLAVFSTSGTDIELFGILSRRPNYYSTDCPSGHPGHGSDTQDALTGDIDWLTCDTTYFTCDATEY